MHLTWGFRSQAIQQCQSNVKTTDPGSHSNEIKWIRCLYIGFCGQVIHWNHFASEKYRVMVNSKMAVEMAAAPFQLTYQGS